MYCQHCGNELGENDKFCTFCGTAVPSSQTTDQPHAEDAPKPQLQDNETESSAENATQMPLKNAVASTRKRSRRKIPMILLVVLVLALASSVAFASYYLYTQVYLPSTQESDAANNRNAQWDEAVSAYQVIVNEYNEALPSSRSDYEEMTEDYPHLDTELLMENQLSGGGDWDIQCAYRDLNNDGVPEMLIGTKGGGALGDDVVYDIWSYQDQTLTLVDHRGFRAGGLSIRHDNYILDFARAGIYTCGYAIKTLNAMPLTDFDEGGWDDNFTLENIQYSCEPTDGDNVAYKHISADGKTETGTCTLEEFVTMATDDLASQYPEETDIEWIVLPTDSTTNR